MPNSPAFLLNTSATPIEKSEDWFLRIATFLALMLFLEKFARTSPWKGSVKQVLKAFFLPSVMFA